METLQDYETNLNFRWTKEEYTIQIKKSAQKGRHVVASRALQSGETIFMAHPYIHSIFEQHKKRMCDRCLKNKLDSTEENDLDKEVDLNLNTLPLSQQEDNSKTKGNEKNSKRSIFENHCKECSSVWYCSKECQQDALLEHQKNCNAFKKLLSNKKLDKDSLNILKMVIKMLNKEENQNKLSKEEVSFQDILNLTSNKEVYSAEDVKDNKIIAQWICSNRPSQLSEDEILNLICKIECNNFGLWNNGSNEFIFGRVMFPLASYFNHSCSPNCSAEKNRDMQLTVVSIINIPEGAELCIPYIDVNLPRSARRQKLWIEYHFMCCCSRCEMEKDQNSANYRVTYPQSHPARKKRRNPKTKR